MAAEQKPLPTGKHEHGFTVITNMAGVSIEYPQAKTFQLDDEEMRVMLFSESDELLGAVAYSSFAGIVPIKEKATT